MAETANHASSDPWPSLETASWLFDRASFVLIGSLILGVLATGVIVWMGIVKEHHWDLLRDSSNEKVAALGLKTAEANEGAAKASERVAELSVTAEQLRKDTAEANDRAAQANDRAEQAKLDLAKFKAPRLLTPEQQQIIVSELTGKLSEINVVSKADVESREYRRQFASLLRGAGLTVHTGSLSPMDTALLGNSNSVVIWSKDWMGVNGFPNPSDPLYSAIFKAGLWGGSGLKPGFIPDGKTESIDSDIPTIFIFQKTPW
ncbi:hypothetical protein [Bradyrhizobium sp. USDA 3650]